MCDCIDTLDGLRKVTSDEILDDGEGQLLGVGLEDRQLGYLLPLVFTADSASDVPPILEESKGDMGCDETGNTGDEYSLGAGHYVGDLVCSVNIDGNHAEGVWGYGADYIYESAIPS